jgi:hypothetical protein
MARKNKTQEVDFAPQTVEGTDTELMQEATEGTENGRWSMYHRAAEFTPESIKLIEEIWERISQIGDNEPELPFNIVEVQEAVTQKIVAQRRKHLLETGAQRKAEKKAAKRAKLLAELAKLDG